MPSDAEKLAAKTKLTNDVKYVADAALVLWHERVPKLLVEKWWDAPATQMDAKLELAAEVFVHWPHHNIDPATMRTKTAKLKLIKDHIKWIKERVNSMSTWVENLGGFHPSVHPSDLKSMFVRPVRQAFDDEIVMEDVEAAVINSCTHINPHYNYHNQNDDDSESEDSECDSIAESDEEHNVF